MKRFSGVQFLQYFTDTMEYLRYLLRKSHQSSQVLQGHQVELICHQEALGRIQTEAPRSVIKWALNGVDVNLEGMRVFMKNNSNLGNLITLFTVHTQLIQGILLLCN
jgi:hypothetical protein